MGSVWTARIPMLAVWSVISVVLGASSGAAQIIAVPSFQIATVGGATSVEVAVGSDGTMLFSWLRIVGTTRELYARRYSSAGVALGPAIRLDAGGDIGTFSLSSGLAGGYALALMHPGAGAGHAIFGLALDAVGVPVGGEFQVSPATPPIYDVDVAGLPSGTVFVWTRNKVFVTPVNEVMARVFDANGQPLGLQFKVGADGLDGRDVAATSDGGFAVCWQDHPNALGTVVRTFDADGTPRGSQHATSFAGDVVHIAGSPSGAGGAVVTSLANGAAALRFDRDGAFVGDPISLTGSTSSRPDLDYANDGHLLAAWTERDVAADLTRVRARALDGSFLPFHAPFWVGDEPANTVRVARTADADGFVVAWSNNQEIYGAVVTLCTPAHAVCGDGVLEPACAEVCDDGAANSDVAPDACRTDCHPAHCGDGVVDGGEGCDDGNLDPCDGCDALCAAEVGLACGDGIPYPACGQSCDDANLTSGDGCGADCVAERAFGGGKPERDCLIEWQIDNPTNAPRYAGDGINPKQSCVDDDAACDFDGGVPGRCTFHIAVCASNTNIAGCEPATRLASWQLTKPSANQAAHDPFAANVRAAFLGTVPAAIVGPSIRDLCSPFVPVEVPLRGAAGAYGAGRLTLKSLAFPYVGNRDTDALKLTCLPALP